MISDRSIPNIIWIIFKLVFSFSLFLLFAAQTLNSTNTHITSDIRSNTGHPIIGPHSQTVGTHINLCLNCVYHHITVQIYLKPDTVLFLQTNGDLDNIIIGSINNYDVIKGYYLQFSNTKTEKVQRRVKSIIIKYK